MATPIDTTQFETDMTNLIGYDIPKSIVIPTLTGTVTVTGLLENLSHSNKAVFGGVEFDVDTIAHIQKSSVSPYFTDMIQIKGRVVTANGVASRAMDITESLDGIMLEIILTNPS